MPLARRFEDASLRKMRTRNTPIYRLLHWPIWILVFFITPGPLTFDLFAGRPNRWNLLWLAAVLVATGIAALRGRLPGAEPAPYILRFTEDCPNPLYRCVCYTFAWNAAINFALMNLLGLLIATTSGIWRMQPLYLKAYPILLVLVLIAGAAGALPRVHRSTKGEGTERRYFYGTVWSVTAAQAVLLVLWKTLPRTHATDVVKLAVYIAVLTAMGAAAAAGLLPRTAPILPGELMVAD
jgi:hypothetical protein